MVTIPKLSIFKIFYIVMLAVILGCSGEKRHVNLYQVSIIIHTDTKAKEYNPMIFGGLYRASLPPYSLIIVNIEDLN